MYSDATLGKQNFATVRASGVRDYISLMKPRVTMLVLFTALTGLVTAPGHVDFLTAFLSITFAALGAGSSAALNMWYDRDIDTVMKRTMKRPIPAGIIPAQNALEFALVLATLSVFFMAIAVGYTEALLLLFAIFFYAVIYTIWLKRRTAQNIVIGGVAGSIPPIIGRVTVTGRIDVESIILFLIIFFWTPPHFWSLSLFTSAEYSKAGIPMLPVIKGSKVTKIYIMIYTLILLPITMLPLYFEMFGVVYFIIAALMNCLFIKYSIEVYRARALEMKARKMFKFSIVYLFAIFGGMIMDGVINATF